MEENNANKNYIEAVNEIQNCYRILRKGNEIIGLIYKLLQKIGNRKMCLIKRYVIDKGK